MNTNDNLMPTNISSIITNFSNLVRNFSVKDTEWQIQKEEYEKRISELEGEVKAHENINIDLLKRIRMLEYALTLERQKNQNSNTQPNVETQNENNLFNDLGPQNLIKEEDLQFLHEKSNRPPLISMLQTIGIDENLAKNLFEDFELNKTELEAMIKKNLDEKLNQIGMDNFKDVIEKQKIQCIYFGGGTSNITRDLSHLEPMFQRVRNLSCNEKGIELHYGINITDDTLDTIIKEKFTTVILCIQSFDLDVLNAYQRFCGLQHKNDIETIIKTLHDNGIKVGIDLIQFVDQEPSILTNDLTKLMALDNKPDEITIAPIYDKKKMEISYFKDFISAVDTSGINEFYNSESPMSLALYRSVNCMRFYQKSLTDYTEIYETKFYKDFYSFIPFLTEYGDVQDCATLGIGSYRNKDKNTYSHVGRYVYCEKYDGKETTYEMLNEVSFYDKARALINFMEAVSGGKEPSLQTSITITNTCCNEHNSDFNGNKMCNYQINSPDKDYVNFLESKIDNKDDILKYLDWGQSKGSL